MKKTYKVAVFNGDKFLGFLSNSNTTSSIFHAGPEVIEPTSPDVLKLKSRKEAQEYVRVLEKVTNLKGVIL